MVHRLLIGIACWGGMLVSVAPVAMAQASGIVWPSGCGTEVQFTNNSGLDLGSLWVAIGADDLLNPPEISRIVLNDGSGLFWRVDDNEDGDDGDGLGELNEIDATPQGNLEGWHRVQAATSGDVIRPGQRYRLTLCAQGGTSLKGRQIRLFGVQPGPTGNGDGGTPTASTPLGISTTTPEAVVTLVTYELPPLTSLTFTAQLTNYYAFGLVDLQVLTGQTDSHVVNVTSSSHGGSWDVVRRVFTFSPPLASSATATLDFTLDQLSSMPPLARTGPQTDVFFSQFVPAYGPLPSWALAAIFAGLAGAGALLLRRRRRLATA